MKGKVLICHRANEGSIGHQPRKVGADVGGPIFVPIERNHAASLCAAPQTPYLLSHRLLALAEAAAARLRRVGFRRGRHHEPPRQLLLARKLDNPLAHNPLAHNPHHLDLVKKNKIFFSMSNVPKQ